MATITRPRRTYAPRNRVKPKHRAQPVISFEGAPDANRPDRYVGPAGRVLVLMFVCFLVWSVLASPGLRRAAEASPIGMRRAASLAVLRPLTRVSAFFGLDRIGTTTDRILGRNAAPAEPPAVPPAVPPAATKRPPAGETDDPDSRTASAPILPKPTAADPLKVLIAGDSIGGDLAYGLSRLLSDKGTFRAYTDTRESTGLARPDYFNWPYQLALDISDRRPDVVVVMFGGNDGQSFLVGDHGVLFGSREWRRVYGSRVDRVMDLVTNSGRPLVWVGLPIMQDPGRSKTARLLNSIYREQANAHPGVIYVDSYSLFANAGGGYSAYLRDRSGHLEQVRESDGIHLTVGAGGTRLAQAVYRTMKVLWQGSTEIPLTPPGRPEDVPHGRISSTGG